MSPPSDPVSQAPASQHSRLSGPEGSKVVYALGSTGSNTVKIGTTGNLPKRVAEIQRMSPVPLGILWTHPGGHEVESYLHRHFKAFRSHGEWFTFEGDPLELLRAAIEGEPWVRKVNLHKPPSLVSARRVRAMALSHGATYVDPEVRAALAASVAQVLAITDPIEQFRAARGEREKIAKGHEKLAALQRETVTELKVGRSWREVGELLGFSGARAEAIAKGR